MRAKLILCSLLMLAACGQPPAPQEQDASSNAPPAPASVPLSIGAAMGGLSENASGDLSVLIVYSDRLVFANAEGVETFSAPSQFLGVTPATSLMAAGGASFADATSGPIELRVETRRLTGAADARLCGGAAPATYVAIANLEPLTALSLVVYSGADAPGPEAHDSAVCGIYEYAVD